jgi:hypothetical protein
MKRKQKKAAESVRCALVDWESIENEEQIERALRTLETQAAQVRDSLTTTTSEDPNITWPLHELDEHVRINATHPLHIAVENLLQCLPGSEWHDDKAGNRMFRNDGGLWAALCDISRMDVTTPAEYMDKRSRMAEVRQKFQRWIESEYLTASGEGERESFVTRMFRLFSRTAAAGTPLSAGGKQQRPKPETPAQSEQKFDREDFQFGGLWLTTELCKSDFELDDSNLSRWASDGCPRLEGRKLRRQKFPPDESRWCYHRVDIEDIDSALNDDD